MNAYTNNISLDTLKLPHDGSAKPEQRIPSAIRIYHQVGAQTRQRRTPYKMQFRKTPMSIGPNLGPLAVKTRSGLIAEHIQETDARHDGEVGAGMYPSSKLEIYSRRRSSRTSAIDQNHEHHFSGMLAYSDMTKSGNFKLGLAPGFSDRSCECVPM